jgi:hypothetical protein
MTSLARLKLLVVPILVLLLGAAMSLKMFPLYSGGGHYNFDASYAYLFNGLLLLAQHVPHQIDHPGTPLQALIALLVYGQWLYLKLFYIVNPDVITAVIAEPERYLLFISRVLLVLNVSALFYFGKKIYQSSNSIFVTIFCQGSLLTYGIFGTKLLFPAPEALVSCLSLYMLAVVSPLIFQNEVGNKKLTNIALTTGLIFGLGFAVKLTFLPLAGLFLLLKTWRQLMLACVAALAGWLLGVLPIVTRLPELYKGAQNILIHTGKYGSGDQGFVDYSQLVGNFNELLKAFPFFYVAVAIVAFCALALIGWMVATQLNNTVKKSTEVVLSCNMQVLKTIAVLLTICVAQTLIVLKHFGQHYMIPALPIAFVGFALLFKLLFEHKPKLRAILKVALAASLATFVIQINYLTFVTLQTERVQHNRSVNSVQRELAKYQNPLVITSYGCYLPQCGVLFGIEYAPAIDKKAGPVLANFYGFNVWNSMLLIDGHGFYPLSVLEPFFTASRPVFLVTRIDFPAFDVFKKELILTAEDQKLYKINGLIKSQ